MSDNSPSPSLSADQLEQFHRDGIVVLPERFSRDEVAELNAALDELIVHDVPENIRERSSGVVRTAMGLHHRHDVFARLVNDPRLLVPAAQALGGEPVYAQQVKINVKEAFTGEQWQWHYDFATHHHEDGVPEPSALNLHIFLDDVNEFNGPLMFIPGSHATARRRPRSTPSQRASRCGRSAPTWWVRSSTGVACCRRRVRQEPC